MSLVSFIGPRPNLLDINGRQPADAARGRQPILDQRDMERSAHRAHTAAFRTKTLDITYPPPGAGRHGGRARALCAEAEDAVRDGYNILILSDRGARPDHVPIPALLALRRRAPPPDPRGPAHQTGLVVETGEAREVHHFALLPATAPRRSTPTSRSRRSPTCCTAARRRRRRRGGESATSRRSARACSRSCPRWASRPTSPTAARRSSRPSAWPRTSSTSTSPAPPPASRGIGLFEVAEEAVRMHAPRLRRRPGAAQRARRRRRVRLARARRGAHVDARRDRQAAARRARQQLRDLQGVRAAHQRPERALLTLRGLFEFKPTGRKPVPLEEVEPASEIVKRFATGAMSLRLDLDRGAHDAGHRDEPHRRQVEHRRGRRGPDRFKPATRCPNGDNATCAATRRSSRWPRAASA
jgi:glutamate synthase (NADPH/NADH) large chain